MNEIPKHIILEDYDKVAPVWEQPDSTLFAEWYLDQSKRASDEQSKEYREFLEKVQEGEASIPSDEQLSRHLIRTLRYRKEGE